MALTLRQEREAKGVRDVVRARFADATIVTDGGVPNIHRVIAGGVTYEARMTPAGAWAAAARAMGEQSR